MPRRLIDRCQPDSIREFRASAQHRYNDGLALSGLGNRTSAIYLWGYAAEMTLKAAYFSFFGLVIPIKKSASCDRVESAG